MIAPKFFRERIELGCIGAGQRKAGALGGKVLGPMVKRIAPDAKVTSVVTIDDIEALAKEIA